MGILAILTQNESRLLGVITHHISRLESTNLHHIYSEILSPCTQNVGHWLWTLRLSILQFRHRIAIKTFSVVLVCSSRPGKRCYTSQCALGRLWCCPCPILWAWYQAMSNTSSPCISVLRINGSQANDTNISLHTFIPCFSMPSLYIHTLSKNIANMSISIHKKLTPNILVSLALLTHLLMVACWNGEIYYEIKLTFYSWSNCTQDGNRSTIICPWQSIWCRLNLPMP